MNELTFIVGAVGLTLSVIAVTAAIIDRRNRRRT